MSSVCGTGLEAVGPLLARLGVDDAVAGHTGRIGWLAAAMAGLALVQFGAEFTRRYAAGKLALGVQHRLRTEVFDSSSAWTASNRTRCAPARWSPAPTAI